MNDAFKNVLADASAKYERRVPVYGESWRVMTFETLTKRLEEEYAEWHYEATRDYDAAKEYDELLDVINVAIMLAARLKMEER